MGGKRQDTKQRAEEQETKEHTDVDIIAGNVSLPLETILLILASTGCVRTISRSRQTCRAVKGLICVHLALWKSVPEYIQTFRAERFMAARAWTPLKLVQIVHGWENNWRYAPRLGIISEDVIPLASLQKVPDVGDVFAIVPMHPAKMSIRNPSSYNWDLGDGNFATRIELERSIWSFASTDGAVIRGIPPLPSYEVVQHSRYIFVKEPDLTTGIYFWDVGRDLLNVCCKDLSSIFTKPPKPIIFTGFGDVAVVYSVLEGIPTIQAASLSKLCQIWTATIVVPQDHRIHSILVDDVHVVIMLGAKLGGLPKLHMIVLDTTSGECLTDKTLELGLLDSVAVNFTVGLCVDTVVTTLGPDGGLISAKINGSQEKIREVRKIFKGMRWLHTTSEALLSYNHSDQSLHVKIFDVIPRLVTHFKVIVETREDCDRILCLYRSKTDRKIKGYLLKIE